MRQQAHSPGGIRSRWPSHLRKAAERTVPALWDRIGQRLDEITPQAGADDFVETGYAPS